MKTASTKTAIIIYTVLFVLSVSRQFIQCTNSSVGHAQKAAIQREDATTADSSKTTEDVRQASRFQTFEIETYWKGALQLTKAMPVKKTPALAQGFFPNQH
jgi:hypothetical protein